MNETKSCYEEENDEKNISDLDNLNTHFIFNALNSIKCAAISENYDPEEVCELVNDIGAYMRYRIQTIKCCRCVPCSEEIRYLKSYINLEKYRYPGIKAEYEINDTDFIIPSMTLIFLSENAIRHGFKNTDKKGNILISTWRTSRYHVIQICDDGVGFREEVINLGNGFGTIGYVKENVKNMCGGILNIESISRQGTSVEIKIPAVTG
ncbi:MAG: histidine kinase [Lachnospiraceae bacterium]|nr:histidine kinase [Lachnospiraceae bacterium]